MSECSYTYLEDVPIVVCGDCGATAFTKERVRHYDSCEPGSSKRWEKYYHQALDEEALDKAYKEI